MGQKQKAVAGETVGAAEFKAQCLKLLDRVREHGVEYVVTKHGRPVARVVPFGAPPTSLQAAFAGRIRVTGDILSTAEDWDAATK